MNRVQCNSCGGIYQKTQPNSSRYFHACPEQIVDQPEITDPITHEILTPAKFKPTPNPRNENEVFNPNPEAPREIIAEGSGFRELP